MAEFEVHHHHYYMKVHHGLTVPSLRHLKPGIRIHFRWIAMKVMLAFCLAFQFDVGKLDFLNESRS